MSFLSTGSVRRLEFARLYAGVEDPSVLLFFPIFILKHEREAPRFEMPGMIPNGLSRMDTGHVRLYSHRGVGTANAPARTKELPETTLWIKRGPANALARSKNFQILLLWIKRGPANVL
jgi:hypothetical protein